MGGGQETKEGKPRISPEAKGKIRRFLGKAGLLVAGGAIGAGIGVAAQYMVSQRFINQLLAERAQRQCLGEYEMGRASEEAIGKVSEINSMVIGALQGEPEKMGEALRNLAKITGNFWFKPENLGALKKAIEESGPDAPLALRMLAGLSENGNDFGEALIEYNLAKVVRAAGRIGSLAGENADGLLATISNNILSNQALGPDAALRIRLAEVALTGARNVGEAGWNAGLISGVAFRGGVQDMRAHVEGIFALVGRIREMGRESEGALAALENIFTCHPQAHGASPEERAQILEELREKAGPASLLEAASYIVNRYADNARIRVTLGIFANTLKKGALPAQRIDQRYAAQLCELTEVAVAESRGNGMHVLGFIERMSASHGFDLSWLDMGLASRAGRMVAGLADRLDGQMGEGMARLNSLLASNYVENGRARMVFPPDRIIDIVEEFSVNMPNAERILHNLRMVGSLNLMNAKNMDRQVAGRLCGLENRLAGMQHRNNCVLDALDRLEDGAFSPAIIRLVEVAVRGRQGAQSAISAIKSLEREINGDRIPYISMLYEVSYGDVEMADEMLSSIYRMERPSLERLANFSYGIAILGAEKVRELHKTFGIEYFNRYDPQVLMEVGANADRAVGAGKPILLAVAGKADWNGAFYGFGGTDLQKLASYYKLLAAEVESDREFTIRVNQIAGMYGDISVLILGGHGEPGSISLGDYAGLGSLSFSDERQVSMLMDSFVQSPVIVLSSCSTGSHDGAIGGMISRMLGAIVYAPTQNSGGQTYELDSEGRIIGVGYGSVPTRVYENGQSRVVENAE